MNTEVGIITYLMLVLVLLAGLAAWKHAVATRKDTADEAEAEETETSTPSVAFTELVIESGYNTPYTEIDELIVSPYGIFCIEKKAHVGYIFGSYDREYWTQCKYAERAKIRNPFHQNYKHIKALEALLGDRVKKPIHNYVLFTDAKLVEVADKRVFMNREELAAAIDKHQTPVYSIDEYREICEILAYESSMSEERMPVHIASLKQHFAAA